MIVLDTNVISELMRPTPDAAVVAWIERQARDALWTTSINEAELFFGIRALPPGRRRAELAVVAEAMFAEDLARRVLPLSSAGARRYGEIVVERGRLGRRIEAFDALIAAIAFVAGATVATRDESGFADCGVPVVNPWTAG